MGFRGEVHGFDSWIHEFNVSPTGNAPGADERDVAAAGRETAEDQVERFVEFDGTVGGHFDRNGLSRGIAGRETDRPGGESR